MITMTHEAQRQPPAMAVTAYKTYAVRALKGVHTRQATCREAGCLAFHHGWTTTVDIRTPLGQAQSRYITRESGRRFTTAGPDGGPWTSVVTFTFPPGQQCFAEHHIQTRPGLYVVRDGDWRGNPTGRKQQLSERAWVDDFGEHQEKLADQQRRG